MRHAAAQLFWPHQTLCVFSQLKDIKHIEWDFHSIPWVMPQEWDFWVLGVPRGSNLIFFVHGHVGHVLGGTLGLWGCRGGGGGGGGGHVAYQINRDDEQNRMQVKFSP